MTDTKKLINVEGLSKIASGIKTYVDKKDQAMDTRMQAVEGEKHSHANAAELDKVTDGKVAAWDAKAEVSQVEAAQAAAEGHADTKVQELAKGAVAQNTNDLRTAEGRITALEGLVVGGEGQGITAILADVAALKTAVGDETAGLVADMDAVEGAIDALEGRMDAVEAFETRIAANEDAIEVLKGEGEGSVKKAVADGIATVVANADADFDTLKEVADWIMTDGTNAAGLQTQVGANKDAIAVLNGTGVGSVTKAVADEAALRDAGDKAVEGKVTAEETRAKGEEQRIEGLVTAEATARQQADTALGGRIDGVIERVAALEGVDHEHANKDVLDGISADKVAAWDKAEQAAKDHADGKVKELAEGAVATAQAAAEAAQGEVDALELRVDALEAIDHDHANKGVLDGISAEKVAAWDGKAEVSAVQTAQAAAEAASGKVDTLRTDMVAVFNALDLQYEENKIKLVLPAEQAGVTTPLGEVELPVLTADEADALIVELGLGE